MRNLFNSVFRPKVRRNPFGLSYTNDFDTDFGLIVPVMIKETLAGEPWQLYNESFVRTQPLRCPAFMQADVSYHWFFVPNRLVYDDWSDFIVRGKNGDTDYDKPYATILDLVGGDVNNPQIAQVTPGSLFDFLNFPSFNDPSSVAAAVGLAKDHRVDMMPFNAYNLIYNEYYRDENLQPEVYLWKSSGRTQNVTDLANYVQEVTQDYSADAAVFVNPFFLRYRAWRKDYFTSALPFLQKGPQISLAGSTIDYDQIIPVRFSPKEWSAGLSRNWFLQLYTNENLPGPLDWQLKIGNQTANPIGWSDESTHKHTPTAATSATYFRDAIAYIDLPELQNNIMTINSLRSGMALAQWFELNARTGSSRYFEYLLGHFGVRDRDSRLQRPEYIGGYSHSIQISEVEQTSSTDSVSPQGNLAGRGLGFSANSAMLYRAPEPGWIFCLQSIRPRAVYYQGWPREYQRWDAFDYYDPLFDHLSEQAIKASELFYEPRIEPLSDNDADFGYTPRFSEYRMSLNQCHNNFRYNLNYWISSRKINTTPRLNSDFISIDGYKQQLYEMFSVPGTVQSPAPHFICHVVNHLKAIRPMSRYATPY